MAHKPDDRSDNADKIERHIGDTIRNMELADDLIGRTENEKTQRELKAKNERRRVALDAMRSEIRDEAGYKGKKS